MKKSALFLSFLFVVSCTKDPIIYTLTTSANPSDGGTVSPSTQQYDEGKTATITAAASAEYVFQSWSGATGSSNSTSVVMNSDKSVTANFVKKKYALTTTVEGEGTVTEKVIKAGAATDYNSGTIVELTAVPNGEWLFVEWKGDVTGTENPTQITIDKAKAITAVFVKKQYPLTIEIEGEGTVSEKVIKAGLATDYNSGTIVELTAEPTGDWEFVEWTGDVMSTENPVQITIDEAKTVKVNFSKTQDPFVSKSPIYTYPNNTVGQIINNYYFPGKYLHTDFINNNIDLYYKEDNLEYYGRMFGRDGIYFDFNNDNKLDVFGFLTNFIPNWGVEKGKFVLADNVLNDSRTKLYFDTDISFGGGSIEANDFYNDGKLEIMIATSNDHENGDGGKANSKPVKIISFKEDGTIMEKEVGNPMGIHDSSSGDIDNDGDVDILVWLFSGTTITARPFLYLNDGSGNFNLTDNLQSFKGLESILNNEGPYPITAVELYDIDNDNNLDIICGYSLDNFADTNWDYGLEKIRIYWGDGTGTFDFINGFTDLTSTSNPYIGTNSVGTSVLGFGIFDYDNDGDFDIVSSVTPNYGGYLLQLYQQTNTREFLDVTSSKFDVFTESFPRNQGKDGDFPNFYNIRFYDKDNDGDFDIVPDGLATWGQHQYVNNLYWENIGGQFIKRESNY
ncbi:VCBS repeat-containing protein [Flavobacteriaceae bacterium]|nr:VCBS repeat-containing protein [Flavobacteriaceae bacterium]